MRRRAWLAWGTIAVAFGSTVFACGLEDGGTLDGIDEHDGAVTTTDGALPDAGSGDAHVTPGDGSTPTDSGPGPDATVDSGPSPVGTFDCGGTKVVECRTDCPTAPIGCVGNSKCVSDCGGGSCAFTGFECSACANDGGTGMVVVESRCVGVFALGSCTNDPGVQRCKCGGASDCAGPADTCVNSMCFECGEGDASTDGVGCKNTKSCKAKVTDPANYGQCP